MPRFTRTCSCCLLACLGLASSHPLGAADSDPAAEATTTDERVTTDAQGRIVALPLSIPEAARNRWPDDWEDGFRDRADRAIRAWAGKSGGSNNALENEKQSYPASMLAFLAGDREEALKSLQAGDAMARNHEHTEGIDLYWCFTLKGQIRKYFFFSQYLDPDYRERMTAGARAWTESDPRPNTELVLLLDSADEEVAAAARQSLTAMWRPGSNLLELADRITADAEAATAQAGEANEQRKTAKQTAKDAKKALKEAEKAVRKAEDQDAAKQAVAAAQAALEQAEAHEKTVNKQTGGIVANARASDKFLTFAAHIRSIADEIGEELPQTTDEWRDWWALITRGDWMVYEEYDRRMNLRPHPQYGIGTGPVGGDWAPQTRGGVVDWRNTDNLRGMRETSIYLLAEATGNDLVRRIFKERIRRTAKAFLGMGMGEWDSESYHPHTIGAYLNLYDFAQDPETRMLAKGILDYLTTAGAVKYFRGGTAGPIKRDYGNLAMWSGHAAFLWLWFDDTGEDPRHYERDLIHAITSHYRPPAAAVAIARGQFDRPQELLATHPDYSNWLPGRGDAPEFHETTWFGRTFQMGSALEGGGYDINGCKILVATEAGCDYVIPSTQKKGNIAINRSGTDRIAQYRNNLVWLNRDSQTPIHIAIPKRAEVSMDQGIAFVDLGATWLAVAPINATLHGTNDKLTGQHSLNEKHGDYLTVLEGTGTAEAPALAGFAIEVGEEGGPAADFAAFKQAVLAKAELAITVAEGTTQARWTSSTGDQVGLDWNGSGAATPYRAGNAFDWSSQQDVFAPANGGDAPISLGWKEYRLHLAAGEHSFIGVFDPANGTYNFEQTVIGD